MPKSKRAKVVPLSKVKKKPKARKERIIDEIREAAEKYLHVFLLSMHNERTTFLQAVRQHFRPGVLICGKNTLMQVAFGTEPSSECQDNIHKLAEMISGPCCLLFTDKPAAEVQSFLAEYRPVDFARCGAVATQTVQLPRGTDALAQLPHSIEHHLRQLGMPTQLRDGVIHLLGDHTICTEGKELTADAAQALKLLGIKMAQFMLTPEAHWQRNGKFEDYSALEAVASGRGKGAAGGQGCRGCAGGGGTACCRRRCGEGCHLEEREADFLMQGGCQRGEEASSQCSKLRQGEYGGGD